MRLPSCLTLVACSASLLCVAQIALAQGAYTITDLGTLSGDTSYGWGINGSGQVTGEATLTGNGTLRAFVISPPYSSMLDLGTLVGGSNSSGFAINDSGQVTGQSNFLSSGTFHAFLISPPYNSMNDLGSLGSDSYGYGINSSGQVVGSSLIPGTLEDVFHAFLISPPYHNMTDLGTLGGLGIQPGVSSFALGINNSGQVVGGSYTPNGAAIHAFLISRPYRSMTDLDRSGGSSEAFGINDSGQLTGSFATSATNGADHAFLMSSPYDNMTDLGTLGGAYSNGFGINSSGQVVGHSTTADSIYHAFLYTSAIGIVDLNTLLPSGSGWTLGNARGINDAGQITGAGLDPNGFPHAYLLTPTSPADLSIQKTVNKDSVRSGGIVKYVLRVENTGPNSALGVSITDVLPNEIQFQNVTTSHGTACTAPATGATGAVTCNLGTLDPGDHATISLLVKVNADAGTTVTNTATVGATSFDTNTANNSSSASVTVTSK